MADQNHKGRNWLQTIKTKTSAAGIPLGFRNSSDGFTWDENQHAVLDLTTVAQSLIRSYNGRHHSSFEARAPDLPTGTYIWRLEHLKPDRRYIESSEVFIRLSEDVVQNVRVWNCNVKKWYTLQISEHQFVVLVYASVKESFRDPVWRLEDIYRNLITLNPLLQDFLPEISKAFQSMPANKAGIIVYMSRLFLYKMFGERLDKNSITLATLKTP